jgi:hypothetical protein
MHLGTAILILGLIWLMVVSPGFRVVAIIGTVTLGISAWLIGRSYENRPSPSVPWTSPIAPYSPYSQRPTSPNNGGDLKAIGPDDLQFSNVRLDQYGYYVMVIIAITWQD